MSTLLWPKWHHKQQRPQRALTRADLCADKVIFKAPEQPAMSFTQSSQQLVFPTQRFLLGCWALPCCGEG